MGYYKALKGEHEREEGVTAALIREWAGSNKKSKKGEGNTLSNQIPQERAGYVHVKSHYRNGRIVNAHWRKKARR